MGDSGRAGLQRFLTGAYGIHARPAQSLVPTVVGTLVLRGKGGTLSLSKVVYRPLYTSTYVLDELVTLILSHPDKANFDSTCEQFVRYDDHAISFTDHMSGVLAAERGIEHVFTFDPDHFRTLGFTAVPDDTGEA